MNEGELGRIINLIMENPTLLSEIKRLASDNKAEEVAGESEISEPNAEVELPVEKEANSPPRVNNLKRRELLSALSPYISESRRKAIESFITIADILDLMRGK